MLRGHSADLGRSIRIAFRNSRTRGCRCLRLLSGTEVQIYAPALLGALRWNQEFSDSGTDPAGQPIAHAHDVSRVDLAFGYRFAAHTQLKLQYSIAKGDFVSDDSKGTLPPNSQSAFEVCFPTLGNNSALPLAGRFSDCRARSSPPINHAHVLFATNRWDWGQSLVLACVANLSGKTHTVQVGATGDNFSPSYLTIEAGDKVQWIWESSFHGNASGTPKNPDGRWNSGVLNSGSSFTYEFPGYPGTYHLLLQRSRRLFATC